LCLGIAAEHDRQAHTEDDGSCEFHRQVRTMTSHDTQDVQREVREVAAAQRRRRATASPRTWVRIL
jgi:hypothetical protein